MNDSYIEDLLRTICRIELYLIDITDMANVLDEATCKFRAEYKECPKNSPELEYIKSTGLATKKLVDKTGEIKEVFDATYEALSDIYKTIVTKGETENGNS